MRGAVARGTTAFASFAHLQPAPGNTRRWQSPALGRARRQCLRGSGSSFRPSGALPPPNPSRFEASAARRCPHPRATVRTSNTWHLLERQGYLTPHRLTCVKVSTHCIVYLIWSTIDHRDDRSCNLDSQDCQASAYFLRLLVTISLILLNGTTSHLDDLRYSCN